MNQVAERYLRAMRSCLTCAVEHGAVGDYAEADMWQAYAADLLEASIRVQSTDEET